MKKSSVSALRVLFLLVAVLAAENALAQFGQNKIVYDKFDWSIYRSTHFQIYFYQSEKDSLQKVASFAESAYDELSRSLNYQIPHPIPLIFYATHAEFEQTNTDLNFIPEGVGAFALPSRDRMVLPIDLTDEKLQELIQHELTHIFEFEILYQGNFLKAVTSSAPQWFIEGLASYYGHDEDNRARKYLRDAVVTDQVPEIAKRGVADYFAYRFGHAVFDFIESEWGKDAVRDFVFEWRTNLSGGVEKVLKRAFDISTEDFDIRFRRYLRQRYLPILTSKGEPIDFGERFHVAEDKFSWELSPVPFPSGDFIAAVSTYKENADVIILSTRDRKLYRALSKGYTTRYEYLVAQEVTTSISDTGRSLAVSPDGNFVAAFVRRERGRDLVLFDVLKGGIAREIRIPLDHCLAPSFSPDGKSVVFAALSQGKSDIYRYDLDNGTIANATRDAAFDEAPVYSRDAKWIYYTSTSGAFAKIFRVDASNPALKEQVTFGEWNDEDASFSVDGSRLFFTSDRDGGVYNIYSVDLSTGETWQHTNVIGGAFTPGVFTGKDGVEKLTFSGFYKLRFALYLADARKPFKKLASLSPSPSPVGPQAAAHYTPTIEVSVDPEKVQRHPSRKLYIDNASVTVGVNTDNTLLSDSTLVFSDNLGDRRFIVDLQSISSYTDFHLSFINFRNRLQLGATIFDTRVYYIGQAQGPANGGFVQRGRRFLRETGILGLAAYPLDRYHRLEGSLGFVSRSLDQPFFYSSNDRNQSIVFASRRDNDPTVGLTLTGDTTLYSEIGPLAGRRYSISYNYTPDLKSGDETVGGNVSKHGGTLTQGVEIDIRQYLRITKRSTFAVRLYGARSTGNVPSIYYFGGLDTVRAYDYASQIGNELAYGDFEYRFPLIDHVRFFGILDFTNIRGRLFVDVGASNFTGSKVPFQFWNGSGHDITRQNPDGTATTFRSHQLMDGRADYGYGFSLGFLGVDLHWDFARQWDFRTSLSRFRTSFYIGGIF
jgi:hypothetical protein